jgi:hypothetical protein
MEGAAAADGDDNRARARAASSRSLFLLSPAVVEGRQLPEAQTHRNLPIATATKGERERTTAPSLAPITSSKTHSFSLPPKRSAAHTNPNSSSGHHVGARARRVRQQLCGGRRLRRQGESQSSSSSSPIGSKKKKKLLLQIAIAPLTPTTPPGT